MIKTFINGSAESVEYTDTPSFNAPPSNIDVYMLASVDAISPPDAREWDFTVDIPNERISTLPDGYTIMIADTREAIESGFGYKTLFKKSEYYGIEHYRIKVNAPFYIGVGNTDVPIPPGDLSIYTVETFWNSSFAFSILGESAKCILFKDDTEPCAVYVNGERQDNISYIPDVAEGVDSASYKSEYKNNLRTLQIEGNTVQETYRGVNLFNINAPLLASPFSIEKTAKPKIENGIIYSGGYNEATLGGIDGCFLFVATNGDGDYTFSFDATCNAIESGMRYWIVGTAEVDGTTNETGPWDYLSPPTDITGNGKYTLTVDNNGYEYIGIAFYSPTQYNIAVTNLQIEKGSVATAYEKYVGGTSVPTIANPRAISNCGNGQIEVDVRGINEFDTSKIKVQTGTQIYISDVGENSITITSAENVPSNNNGFCGTRTRLDVICPNIKAGKTYRLSFKRSTPSHTNNFIYLSGTGITWNSGTTKTISENMLDDTVVFYGYNYAGANPKPELPVSVDIFDIMLTEVQDAEYEPYIEPTTVSIPANVVLESGANETLLELAKIGDIADTITIGRVNNEVKYIQRICRVRPFENVGGTLSYGGGGVHNIWTFALDKTSKPYITPVCEFARVLNDDDYATLGADEFGVFFAYEDYVYIYIPSSLGINSLQALEDYLMQTQGERLSIEYVLETPIEWTITDDMGANNTPANLKTNLFEWAKNTKNQTNIIEITSTPSVSKTSVNYAKWGGVPNENNT